MLVQALVINLNIINHNHPIYDNKKATGTCWPVAFSI